MDENIAVSQSALDLTSSINLPPRPDVLNTFTEEMESSNPDADRIVDTIKKDASLYGSVLQVVNSPFFGLKVTVTSVKQAVMLLGLERVYSVVQASILRSSLGKGSSLDRFWDSSVEVASLSGMIAKELASLHQSPDDAYTLGMFHDVGVPLMMMAFPKYKRSLQKMITDGTTSLGDEEVIQFGCNRYHVGYRLGQKWFLPEYMTQAILYQPVMEKLFSGEIKAPINTAQLLAILTLAKSISESFNQYWRLEGNEVFKEQAIAAAKFLGMNNEQFEKFHSRIVDLSKD